jgi:hypothetical protein
MPDEADLKRLRQLDSIFKVAFKLLSHNSFVGYREENRTFATLIYVAQEVQKTTLSHPNHVKSESCSLERTYHDPGGCRANFVNEIGMREKLTNKMQVIRTYLIDRLI